MTEHNAQLPTNSSANAEAYPKPVYWIGMVGLVLILAGAALAYMIRTSDGISVSDIRFKGQDGTVMSALLYVPQDASPESLAPGILAVHGYINSREMQDGFAIEFARRGYVVLSLDQTGHGYSGGLAFSNGFGGPDGLRHLRSLPMVDKNQIGLEGHSMGGWTVLAAAAAMPDAYQSMVLEGSSTGAPFAQEGSETWPRNLAMVFSRYDEFSELMWGVDRSLDTPKSPKLQSLFGTSSTVIEGKIYGSIETGSARVLHQPNTTHPGDHLSRDAIGRATDWFAGTLKGGTARASNDQIWYWKELGTGIGLIGFIMLILSAFDALVRLPLFQSLRKSPSLQGNTRDRRWWQMFLVNSMLPALVFFPAFIAASLLVPASTWLPQSITTQVAAWALLCAALTLLIGRWIKSTAGVESPKWLLCLLIAAATVGIGYLSLVFVDLVFGTDFRFWVVAIKLPSLRHLGVAAIYIVPITGAFLITLKPLCAQLIVDGDSNVQRYFMAVMSMTLGFVILLGIIYGILFTTGSLITSFDPLSTVIALQFIPLLTAIAIITMFCWRRTGSHTTGALIVGPLVTLYVVAGTATQV
ncbi:MAG: pimeloyl-ACP methyl ester carboxylesterase [Arenicella sp.]|jgi:pimeloyl-ACP methyl ester carboxylesterase